MTTKRSKKPAKQIPTKPESNRTVEDVVNLEMPKLARRRREKAPVIAEPGITINVVGDAVSEDDVSVTKNPLPAPAAPVKSKISDDDRQAILKQLHAKFGVPKSFRATNLARLNALLTDTKASQLTKKELSVFPKTEGLAWQRWALSEFRKLEKKATGS